MMMIIIFLFLLTKTFGGFEMTPNSRDTSPLKTPSPGALPICPNFGCKFRNFPSQIVKLYKSKTCNLIGRSLTKRT